jgi:hypothetical protein
VTITLETEEERALWQTVYAAQVSFESDLDGSAAWAKADAAVQAYRERLPSGDAPPEHWRNMYQDGLEANAELAAEVQRLNTLIGRKGGGESQGSSISDATRGAELVASGLVRCTGVPLQDYRDVLAYATALAAHSGGDAPHQDDGLPAAGFRVDDLAEVMGCDPSEGPHTWNDLLAELRLRLGGGDAPHEPSEPDAGMLKWALDRWDLWASSLLGVASDVRTTGRVHMREQITKLVEASRPPGGAEPVEIEVADLVTGDTLDNGEVVVRVSPWTNGGLGTGMPTRHGFDAVTSGGRHQFARDRKLKVVRKAASEGAAPPEPDCEACGDTGRAPAEVWQRWSDAGMPVDQAPDACPYCEPGETGCDLEDIRATASPEGVRVTVGGVEVKREEPSTVPDAPGWWWRLYGLRHEDATPVEIERDHASGELMFYTEDGWEPVSGSTWGGKVERCTPGDAGLRSKIEAIAREMEATIAEESTPDGWAERLRAALEEQP